jgi:transcription elongation GreA/GreB family factor
MDVMNKANFLQRLLETLHAELQLAVKASKDAAEYATNEESRAESQWDTQGLEASYLAAGQASQARQWVDAIQDLQADREAILLPKSQISLGALCSCDFGDSVEHFFFASTAGGQAVAMDDYQVTVITAQSPLAGRLLGRKSGDRFRLPNGSDGQVLTVE